MWPRPPDPAFCSSLSGGAADVRSSTKALCLSHGEGGGGSWRPPAFAGILQAQIPSLSLPVPHFYFATLSFHSRFSVPEESKDVKICQRSYSRSCCNRHGNAYGWRALRLPGCGPLHCTAQRHMGSHRWGDGLRRGAQRSPEVCHWSPVARL